MFQVFLSAEPDHWCHVPELVNYSSTYSNLSLGHIKRLAIPRIDLGSDRADIVLYEKCFQYDVNFTDVYVKNGYKWPKRADPSWSRVPCKQGWDFDHSEYKNTLVTEVGSI
jgi:OCT family organic cation transporter-like MFS transporter 4/5